MMALSFLMAALLGFGGPAGASVIDNLLKSGLDSAMIGAGTGRAQSSKELLAMTAQAFLPNSCIKDLFTSGNVFPRDDDLPYQPNCKVKADNDMLCVAHDTILEVEETNFDAKNAGVSFAHVRVDALRPGMRVRDASERGLSDFEFYLHSSPELSIDDSDLRDASKRSELFTKGQKTAEWIRVQTVTKEVLTISPRHLLFVRPGGAVQAQALKESTHSLFSSRHGWTAVEKIERISVPARKIRPYAPLTSSGTYFANDLLISAYTDLSAEPLMPAFLRMKAMRLTHTDIASHKLAHKMARSLMALKRRPWLAAGAHLILRGHNAGAAFLLQLMTPETSQKNIDSSDRVISENHYLNDDHLRTEEIAAEFLKTARVYRQLQSAMKQTFTSSILWQEIKERQIQRQHRPNLPKNPNLHMYQPMTPSIKSPLSEL